MSSINQPDVAYNQNSGSSIVTVAKRGKHLPHEATGRSQQDPAAPADNGIEPQNARLARIVTTEPAVRDSRDTAYDREQIRKDTIASAVTQINDYIQNEQRDIEFSVNDEAGLSVVRVVNRHSRELVRQIPTDEVVDLARKLNDQEPLRLFSAQV